MGMKYQRKPARMIRKKSAPKASTSLATMVKATVNRAINRKAESKTAIYYNNGSGLAGDGTYANRGWAAQNQSITSTVNDLHRMLPFVYTGVNENQRIGDRISPVSLSVQGTVKIRKTVTDLETAQDLFAVIYVLEHVTYKSYTSLIAGNDFTQLLKNGENTTNAFEGEVWQAQQPVADQYYRLLKKKVVRLRYAGITSAQTPPAGNDVSIANCHDYQAKFSLGLSKKHLPTLKYPESSLVAGQGDPLNVAPFFAVGFYWADGTTYLLDQALIEQQYVSVLKFKDM